VEAYTINTPHANTSTAGVSFPPRNRSGAMNLGVPIKSPVCVSSVVASNARAIPSAI
jgi:hypothetical protein